MLNKLQSIPTVFKALMMGFLTIMMIYICYPISNHIMGLFTTGTMMYYASVIVFWLIIIFVTWFLMWVMLFQPQGGAQHG